MRSVVRRGENRKRAGNVPKTEGGEGQRIGHAAALMRRRGWVGAWGTGLDYTHHRGGKKPSLPTLPCPSETDSRGRRALSQGTSEACALGAFPRPGENGPAARRDLALCRNTNLFNAGRVGLKALREKE